MKKLNCKIKRTKDKAGNVLTQQQLFLFLGDNAKKGIHIRIQGEKVVGYGTKAKD